MKFNKILTIVTACVFVLLFGGYYYLSHSNQEDVDTVVVDSQQVQEEEQNEEEGLETMTDSGHVTGHVCGAVKTPGVYELESEARICDAITAAGGLKKKADECNVNQAQLLTDGQQVYIPYKSEAHAEKVSSEKSSSDSSKVNINTATAEELTSIPGIGEAKATSIIQYREEKGSFSSIDEIKNISGIKDGVFARIEAYITV